MAYSKPKEWINILMVHAGRMCVSLSVCESEMQSTGPNKRQKKKSHRKETNDELNWKATQNERYNMKHNEMNEKYIGWKIINQICRIPKGIAVFLYPFSMIWYAMLCYMFMYKWYENPRAVYTQIHMLQRIWYTDSCVYLVDAFFAPKI